MAFQGGPSDGRSSLIGVAISLGGNVLISLALNCQKLAHLRLQQEAEENDPSLTKAHRRRQSSHANHRGHSSEQPSEQEPLLRSNPSPTHYDDASPTSSSGARVTSPNSKPTSPSAHSRNSSQIDDDDEPVKPSSTSWSTEFLKSRLWWLGLALMTLGEFGNFLSYGFAPASLVAPLGAVALLANVVFSPILLKEKFRPSDLGGMLLAIIGAVTVVFSSKQSDTTLNPDQLWDAISRKEFITYAVVAIVLGLALAWGSSTRFGDQYIMLDLGVCAVSGGFTVLSTKGVSSLLSHGPPVELLRSSITYVLLVVLVGTALAQITYLNRALQRFDSREVIPTQFVMFTISAIVGSAILYQDFANMDVHRLINFLFGCLTTFAGVFFLTSRKEDNDQDLENVQSSYDEEEEEVDAIEGQNADTQSSHSPIAALPVAVPKSRVRRGTNPRRLRAKPSILGLTSSGSLPTVTVRAGNRRGLAPSIATGTSLDQARSVPVMLTRRSIFNPTFAIYLDSGHKHFPRKSTPRSS